MPIYSELDEYIQHMTDLLAEEDKANIADSITSGYEDYDEKDDEVYIHPETDPEPSEVLDYYGYTDGDDSKWISKGFEDGSYRDIYRSREFTEAVSTILDMKDRNTGRFVMSLNEADQATVLKSLTSKLYDNIVKRIDHIDYGDIPKSRGDITKIPNYAETCECIDLIRQIIDQFHEKPDSIDEINHAITNMIKRTPVFTKAYSRKVEFVMNIYCNMCMAIIASTSYMISTCIEFIKSPADETFSATLDKMAYVKTKDAMLLNILRNFNKSCANGDLDKAMDAVMNPSNRKNLAEGATVFASISIITGLALIVLCGLGLLRQIVYYIYHARMSASDYFAIQADLLQMNAMNLQISSRDIKNKDVVIKRQLNIVDTFRKISNFFAINNKKAEINASKDIANDERKSKLSDIKNDLPEDVSKSSLF